MPTSNDCRFLRIGRTLFSRSRSASPGRQSPAGENLDSRVAPTTSTTPLPSDIASASLTPQVTKTGSKGPLTASLDSSHDSVILNHERTTSTSSGGPFPELSFGVTSPGIVVSDKPDPADDIFREALHKHTEGLTTAQKQAFLGASAAQIMDIVQDLDQRHGKDSFTRKSAMKVQGFLGVADGYLHILGTFVQHSPEFSSLVVGGLKIFVDIGMRYAGFFDKLSETMQKITGHLDYLSRYAKLYGHYTEVKKALCDAYGDLISFCKTTSSIFMNEEGHLSNKISARILFKQLSSPLESNFDDINKRFTDHISRVEKTANILEKERKLLKESLEAREKADFERSKLLSWLSQLEPEDDLERIYAKRHANTGLWLIKSEDLGSWFDAGKHCLLWCYGPAGVGKSVFASILVEEVTSRHPFDDHIGVAFYYFNFQNEIIQLRDILAILIKQLCRRTRKIPSSLQSLYRQCSSNDKSPKLSELKVQFQEIIETFEEVYLVIDAMDECRLEHRKQLLTYLVSLFERSSGRLKIFVTSRPEVDIKRAFTSNKFQTIQIEATKIEEDIKSYVHHELHHRSHDYCDIDEQLREVIESALLAQSSGMFLWVRCQLDYIYQQPSKKHMRDALKSLPVDMAATYRRILDRINNNPEPLKALAKRSLTWVITAKRPLDPSQLALAVAIEPSSDCAMDLYDQYKPQAIIDSCCGLLTAEGGLVRPIHFTVKEFLRDSETGIPGEYEANIELLRSSLQFMSCKELSSGFPMTVDMSDLLMKEGSYFFHFWDHHVRSIPPPLPNDTMSDLRRFLGSSNISAAYEYRVGDSWDKITALGLCAAADLLPLYRQFYTLDNLITPEDLETALRGAALGGAVSAINTLLEVGNVTKVTDGNLLFSAVAGGHEGAARVFVERGADVNAVSRRHGTALQAAAHGGHVLIVEYLLSKGADVDMRGGVYGTALQAASYQGHASIVELLISVGASIDIVSGRFGVALQAASFQGHSAIVDWLLSNNADVNTQGGKYGTPLEAAAYGGHIFIVESLISNGAMVNTEDGKFGTALQGASYGGHLSVVEYLLSNGAEANTQCGKYGNALQAASAGGHTSVFELLLSKGADVSAQGGKYGNTLQAASTSGNILMVESLLSSGVDVNTRGGEYETALLAASYHGNLKIVERLLSDGADINAQSDKYGTALNAACAEGHELVVDYLLSKGMDVNVTSGEQYTALIAASRKGCKPIIERLLLEGADVNTQGGEWNTPLTAASDMGHKSVVEYLLSKGADVNLQGGYHGTALHAASHMGYRDIVEILLSKGADVNISCGPYGNALQAACYMGDLSVFQLLLSHGADPNIQGGRYNTVLVLASLKGYKSIVDLLISSGADVNLTGGQLNTALVAASCNGDISIFNSLLPRVTDVNALGGACGTALHAASFHGHISTVNALLAAGADVNVQGGQHTTALHAACFGGHTKIVKILLENGADITVQYTQYGGVIQAAVRSLRHINRARFHSQRNVVEMVQLLLDNGADVNSRGGMYGCALTATRYLEPGDPIVNLLLRNGAVDHPL